MIFTRKLFLPAVILLSVFLAGLFAYFFSSLHEAYHEAEEETLANYADSFFAEIEYQKQLAVSLAVSSAQSPAVQEALANRDHEALSKIIQPALSRLQSTDIHILQNRFYLPDGSLFVSAGETNVQSESPLSPTIAFANSQLESVAGIELSNGKLIVRGISPVFQQGRHIGAVGFEIGVDESLLQGMEEKYGAAWRILLPKDVAGDIFIEESPNENFMVVAQTEGALLFNNTENYSEALAGRTIITHPSQNGRDYAIQSSPMYDFSGRVVGVLDIVYDHTHISAAQNNRLVLAGLVSIGVLVISFIALYFVTRRTLQPIQTLTRAAAEISEGNSMAFVNVKTADDEVGVLVDTFNRMTGQLRGSITDLEQRVAERTKDLEEQTLRLRVAAEISQSSTSVRHLGDLLEWSARLILDRFDYYHVGIYILDKEGKQATLVAAPTTAGRQLISENHRIRVGDATVAGRVAATGEPRIADEETDIPITINAFLPDTRSELALPLKADNRVIGILDIQSTKPQAFKSSDVSVMLVLADQLAGAIERTRLLEESANNFLELERAYGRFTREGWQKFASSGRMRNKGYRFDNIRIEPIRAPSDSGKQALESSSSVRIKGNDSNMTVSIPIKFRGQTIGVVDAKLREGYGDTAISTLELAIDRLASSLESARLYEEARIRADREQAISQITTSIGSSSDYETILRTTVREIGTALNDADVSIQIVGENIE